MEKGKADECRVGGVGNTRRGGVWRRRAGEKDGCYYAYVPPGRTERTAPAPRKAGNDEGKKGKQKKEVQRCPSLPENQERAEGESKKQALQKEMD